MSDLLRLACDSGRTGYDCEFAVLAIDLEVRLATTDRQFLDPFPEFAVPLTDFDPGRTS